MQRGQISITVAIVGAIATVVVGTFSAYATSNSRVAEIDTKVQVLSERQDLQYKEVSQWLTRVESKLDKAIK